MSRVSASGSDPKTNVMFAQPRVTNSGSRRHHRAPPGCSQRCQTKPQLCSPTGPGGHVPVYMEFRCFRGKTDLIILAACRFGRGGTERRLAQTPGPRAGTPSSFPAPQPSSARALWKQQGDVAGKEEPCCVYCCWEESPAGWQRRRLAQRAGGACGRAGRTKPRASKN